MAHIGRYNPWLFTPSDRYQCKIRLPNLKNVSRKTIQNSLLMPWVWSVISPCIWNSRIYPTDLKLYCMNSLMYQPSNRSIRDPSYVRLHFLAITLVFTTGRPPAISLSGWLSQCNLSDSNANRTELVPTQVHTRTLVAKCADPFLIKSKRYPLQSADIDIMSSLHI